jgi:hypothetical protein
MHAFHAEAQVAGGVVAHAVHIPQVPVSHASVVPGADAQ